MRFPHLFIIINFYFFNVFCCISIVLFNLLHWIQYFRDGNWIPPWSVLVGERPCTFLSHLIYLLFGFMWLSALLLRNIMFQSADINDPHVLCQVLGFSYFSVSLLAGYNKWIWNSLRVIERHVYPWRGNMYPWQDNANDGSVSVDGWTVFCSLSPSLE
jgi:hypothetical protein